VDMVPFSTDKRGSYLRWPFWLYLASSSKLFVREQNLRWLQSPVQSISTVGLLSASRSMLNRKTQPTASGTLDFGLVQPTGSTGHDRSSLYERHTAWAASPHARETARNR
jgi:hypothetical protein